MACKEKVRQMDLFGQPISLVYKGEKFFKTRCGGCISIIFVFFIVLFLIEEMIAIKVLGRDFNASFEDITDYYNGKSAAITFDDTYSMMGQLSYTFDNDVDDVDIDSLVRI